MAKVKAHGLLGPSKSSSKSKKQASSLQMEGYERIDYCTRMLQAIVTKNSETGPQNYFFFSGYLSGILLNSKPLQIWPFVKVSSNISHNVSQSNSFNLSIGLFHLHVV